MVGATGFEPATSSPRTKRATKLRYAPTERPEYDAFRLLSQGGSGAERPFLGRARLCRIPAKALRLRR